MKLLPVLLFAGVSFAQSSPDVVDCSRWTGPRMIHYSDGSELFETQAIGAEVPVGSAWIFSGDSTWSIAMETDYPASVLLSGPGGIVRLCVPSYAYRPLEARWVKPGILFLEIWFNPHYGAYAVFDAAASSVLVSELFSDGTDAWRQYLEATGTN